MSRRHLIRTSALVITYVAAGASASCSLLVGDGLSSGDDQNSPTSQADAGAPTTEGDAHGGAADTGSSTGSDGGSTLPDGAPAPFTTPAALANIELWLSADTISAGDGAAVTTWNDSSPAGRSATQATCTNPPHLAKTSGVPGRAAVVFNGQNECLKLGAGFAEPSRGMSLFVVAKIASAPTGNTPSQGFVDLLKYAGGGRIAIGADKSGTLRGVVSDDGNGANSLLATGAAPIGAFHLYSFIVGGGSTGAPSSSELRRNAVTVASGTVPAPPDGVRDWNWVGWWKADDVAGCFLSGAIGEVIVVGRALATGERNDVETYLRNRWAL